MSFEKIAVVGAGGWGTALGILLARGGREIRLWGYDPAHVEALKATRRNEPFLPGIEVPANIRPTNSMADAADADLVLFVPPSKAMRSVSENFAREKVRSSTVILTCTKGIEQGSGRRMSEIVGELFPENPIAVLSGPSHAEEVARGMPTAVVVGCAQESVAERLQQIFSAENFRAYTSGDVAGIELGGALKNVLAIAAGVSDGLGFGDNSKAALVTRSLAELTRLGVALGGQRETFQGLSGVGDLMVTCFSRHSRNRGVGERLGRGETLAQIAESMSMVAEGVPTAKSALECAVRLDVKVPIIEQVNAILFEEKSPRHAMSELLGREPRPEQDSR
ncbi:MAG: glycerol-3-phosphate dehydrogenase [Chthoniobacter sp.]|jgi:glycerol-3-phosphate dehydrogenase (NAD(P)+)|nr:glycerol-3-phosphate dehydrogenase [Chthoniobacter sp.]